VLTLVVDCFHVLPQLIDMSFMYILSSPFSHSLVAVRRYYHFPVPADVASMSATIDRMSAMADDQMSAGQHLVQHFLMFIFIVDVS